MNLLWLKSLCRHFGTFYTKISAVLFLRFFSMKISLQRYFKAAVIKTNKEKNYLNEIFLQYKMQLSTRKE